jgi:Ca2+-binding EF-hand superfamily protein
MSHNLTPKQIEEFRKVFNTWDKDKNGEISLAELRAALNSKGNVFSEQEIQELMKAGDLDGNGTLSFKEFLAME